MIEPETRENTIDIIYDRKLTQDIFQKHLSLSWSAFDNFQTCQGLWFINYFLKSPIEIVAPTIKEHSRAIPGTIIQKVIEVFLNDRVYHRPEMTTLSALIEWLQKNTLAIYHLGIFPVEYQFKPDFIKTKNFWANKYGKDQRKYVQYTYGLDDAFKEVNLSFVDKTKFNAIYGSEDSFLIHLCSLYPKILDAFVKRNVFLDKMMSEVYLKVPLKEFNLSGSIDFIYNPKQRDDSYFTTLTQLQNGYSIFDGKYNISSYTKEEQLFFYCYLIYLKTKKLPEKVSLISWNKAEFKDFEFDLNYRDKVEGVLATLLKEGKRIKTFLENKKEDKGLFFRDEITSLNPSENNCQFCSAIDFCPAAQGKGLKSLSSSISEKMYAKMEAKKIISELPPGNPDVSL